MAETADRIRWWVDGEPTPRLRALLADPEGVLRGPGSVARESGGRKRFYRLDDDAGRPELFVKVFHLPPGPGRLRYLLRPSKARREAAVARAAVARGFEAAAPVAVGEERRFGVLRRSLSVVPAVPAPDVRAALRDPATGRVARRRLIAEFAAFSKRLHDAGIDQDDFSTNNFLAHGEGRFVLIDFERCKVGDPLDPDRRITLLAKLARREPSLSRADRLRFLRDYLGADAPGADLRTWCGAIGREFLEIRRRDARHAARAAFKEGRHLLREGDSWLVRERRDAKTVHVSSADPRALWTLAFQLERLDLPALRAVRLDGSGVDLALPAEAPARGRESRTRSAFEQFGRFKREPEWLHTADGPVLRNLDAFALD